MKQISFIIVIFSLVMCKSPKVEFAEYEKTVSDYSIQKNLEQLDATKQIYSVLMFTQGFEGEKILIENNENVIYNDTLKTISGFGLAKQIRIDNTYPVQITEVNRNYSFKLKPKELSRHKYIYIQKYPLNGGKYSITYSNSMRSFR